LTDFIGIVGTLLGASIGAIITILGSFRVAKWQDRRKACDDFYMAFDEEIGLLQTGISTTGWSPNEQKTAYDILFNAAAKHDRAIRHFRRHIKRKRDFDNTWGEYRCKESKQAIEDDPFVCYASKPGDFETETKKRQLALERIDKLLKFAKP